MDNSPFSVRRGKATVTSSHDFISDTQATLGAMPSVFVVPAVSNNATRRLLSACRWHLFTLKAKRDFGTFPLADARQTIPVSGTRKRGAHVRFWHIAAFAAPQ